MNYDYTSRYAIAHAECCNTPRSSKAKEEEHSIRDFLKDLASELEVSFIQTRLDRGVKEDEIQCKRAGSCIRGGGEGWWRGVHFTIRFDDAYPCVAKMSSNSQ